jgi:hypothetical protein
MDPLNPAEVAESRAFSFDNAWMWTVVIIAAVFVGYLCFDVLKIYLRGRRLEKRKEEARRNQG